MTQSLVIEIARDALTVSILVGAPILGVSLVVGVLVSLIQAVTQIQEMTLTFVPKTLAIAITLLVFGPWMLSTLTTFTANMLASLANYAR